MALDAAQQAHVRVAVLSDRSMPINDRMETVDVDGLFIMSIDTPQAKDLYDAVKRIFDFCAAAILLCLLSPLLLAMAILISLESPGGAFFRQERVGKQGVRFQMWKFRSMYQNVPIYEVSPATPMDERITKFGRLIRKVSLDELPQLINVLAGDMSLVGPRPEMPFLVDQYNSFQRQRLEVIPGITGLWQLSADRAFHIHENIQYDMYYIRNRGFFLDLAILLHTVIFAVRGI
jgi:lipopolysaccharide/colanic/teichoic acid biosynthesis glycosyltransferase